LDDEGKETARSGRDRPEAADAYAMPNAPLTIPQVDMDAFIQVGPVDTSGKTGQP
jgi:hypothetical protein